MAFSPYLVKTLGRFAIRAPSGDVQGMQQKKRVALIALLAAAAGDGVPRDRVLLYLSPDSTEERARNALYQLVYRIRQELGDGFIIGEAQLTLNPAIATSDVRELRLAAARGDYAEVLRLYEGPFLDGFALRDAREFDEWLESQRRELHHLYMEALQRAAAAARNGGDLPAAIDAWRRAATAEPTNVAVALGLVSALAAAGEIPAALRHADIYTLLVRDQLGIEPDPRVTTAVHELRSGEARRAPTAPLSARTLSVAGAGSVTAPIPSPGPIDSHTDRARRRRTLWFLVPTAALGAIMFGLQWRSRSPDGANAAVVAHSSALQPGMVTPPAAVAPASVAAPEPPHDLGRVLVVPFETRGSDSALTGLGRLAAEWVSGALTQAGVLDVVDGSTAADISNSDASPGSGPNARRGDFLRAAEATGARTLVVGRFLASGDSIVARASIEEAQSGRVLRTIPPFTAGRHDTKRLLELVRNRVGAAFASLVDPRVESLIDRSSPPPSLEAYREYSAGINAWLRSTGPDRLKAREYLSGAIRADSSWALPYIWLLYAVGPRSPQGDTIVKLLAARRSTLSPVDRSALDYFEANQRNDFIGSYHAAQRASQLAPRSSWTYMRARAALQLMHYAEARDALRELDPEHGWVRGWGPYFSALNESQHSLGDYRAQLKDDERAARLGIESGLIPYLRLTALVGLGDSAQVMRIVDSLIAEPPVMAPGQSDFDLPFYLAYVSMEAMGHGRSGLANHLLERCVAALPAGNEAGPVTHSLLVNRSICLFYQGRLDEARAGFERELTLPGWHGTTRHYLAALAARRGDTKEARAQMTAGIAAMLPTNRALDSLYFIAMFAAGEGRKADAMSALRQRSIAGWLHSDALFANLFNYPPFVRYVHGK